MAKSEVTAVQIIHGQLAGTNVHAHAAHGKGSERRRRWPANLCEPKAGAGQRRRARLVQAGGSSEERRRGAEVVGAANLDSEEHQGASTTDQALLTKHYGPSTTDQALLTQH